MSNSQELKGIREEKPLRERGVIILFSEAGWGLFDRIPHGQVHPGLQKAFTVECTSKPLYHACKVLLIKWLNLGGCPSEAQQEKCNHIGH